MPMTFTMLIPENIVEKRNISFSKNIYKFYPYEGNIVLNKMVLRERLEINI